ncbi:RNA-binding S4 domain-containing protein [Thalassotalea sediminis]|uniref:RNA-binding S4 domain-containing protein n=1 Tax=Thalassotalea sediminis TaxID=1759089 RepID=UPI0025726183|nr:RNA-binding S4 domain-containing protein [Thalassotalea sediminis]
MTIEIEVSSQPIELYKLLKIANLVSGGGEAKIVIMEGYVQLNGEVVVQKRKKVYHEDIVSFNGENILLICHQAPKIPEKRIKKTKQLPKEKSSAPRQVKGGRKKINF